MLISLLMALSVAHAKDSLWERTCNVLLNRESKISTEAQAVRASFEDALYETNRFSQTKMRAEARALDFLKDKPLSVEIAPTATFDHNVESSVRLRAFAMPDSLTEDWSDERHTLSAGRPTFAILFDPDLKPLLEEEIRAVADRNTSLNLTVDIAGAESVFGAQLGSSWRGSELMWIRGDINNKQVKRALLLAFDHAYSRAIQSNSTTR